MPDRPVKDFLRKAFYSVELWGFTEHELEQPKKCQRSDQFVGYVTPDEEFEIRVMRDGTIISLESDDGTRTSTPEAAAEWRKQLKNRYVRGALRGEEGDFMVFLPPLMRKRVYGGDNLPQNELDETFARWRWVRATTDGKFLGWDKVEESTARELLKVHGRASVLDQVRATLERWGWEFQWDVSNVRFDFEPLFAQGFKGRELQGHARLKFKIKPGKFLDLKSQMSMVDIGHIGQSFVPVIKIEDALPWIGRWTQTFCTNPEGQVPQVENARAQFREYATAINERAEKRATHHQMLGWI